VSYVRSDSGSLSYWIGIPLLLIAALAEASVLPLFRISGLQPNLVLVVLTAWVMVRGQDEVLYLVPLAGIFLGLAEGAQLGAALLALAPVAVLHELRGTRLPESHFVIALLFAVAVSVLYNVVYLIVFAIEGEGRGAAVGAARVILLSTLLNLVIFPLAYGFIWAASGDRRRAAFA
jgi:rod shape-determining protein MreD